VPGVKSAQAHDLLSQGVVDRLRDVLAVRWYLRFGLSYRDVEELLAERGVEVDHVTLYRWVQRFAPMLAEAARPCRHAVGDRWWADETYVKVAGQWRYVYRAIDQFGQVIDVFVSQRRDAAAARRFFEKAIGSTRVTPTEVVTDRAAVYPKVLEDLAPAAWHRTEQYANNRMEGDHGQLNQPGRTAALLRRACGCRKPRPSWSGSGGSVERSSGKDTLSFLTVPVYPLSVAFAATRPVVVVFAVGPLSFGRERAPGGAGP
jgi:transposase-like protein